MQGNVSLPGLVIHLPHANTHLWVRGHTHEIRVTYVYVVKWEDKGNEEEKGAKQRQVFATPAPCLSKKQGCRMCKRTVKTYIFMYACLRLTNTQKNNLKQLLRGVYT